MWLLNLKIYILVVFLGGLYAYYKYHQVRMFESKFQETIKDKRKFFDLHQKIAFGFDSKVEENEKRHRIEKYRKSILQFAEGVRQP